MTVSSSPLVGFYGKLPSHGDFLRRRVSDGFVRVWDEWLQQSLAASHAALGGEWRDFYLTSPAWRFAAAAGVFDGDAALGVMVPSVDSVGRYFYVAVVAHVPASIDLVRAASTAREYFDRAERLVLDALASEQLVLHEFDAAIVELSDRLGALLHQPGVVLGDSASYVLADAARGIPWQVPLLADASLAPALEQLAGRRLAMLYDPLVMWWTEGSRCVEPSCLVANGLPRPDQFAAMLDGTWRVRGWNSVEASVEEEGGPTPPLTDDPIPPRLRSVGRTDVGRVRSINQDSFLERPEAGLWVVADGVGGHSDGEVASRMVCDALADVMNEGSFEQMIARAGERVEEVNAHLIRAATREFNAVRSGTTIVALFVRGTRCAVLWAGDSRAYRFRSGTLEQLTQDHSVEAIAGEAVPSTAITRAVGGDVALMLDQVRDRVVAGDRLLLCSDGLTRTLSDEEISHWLRHPQLQAAVDGLIGASLEAGGPDNVTAVVVEAYV
jgi:type VI secretion system protein ImpM